MMRAFAHFAVTLGLMAAPSHGQSFDEAVRANVALATHLCAQSMLSGSAPSQVFVQAGFAYRGDVLGTNSYGVDQGTRHYFVAPADTAKTHVMNADGHPGLCTVLTTHLQEAELRNLVLGVLRQTYPQIQTGGGPGAEMIIKVGSNLPLLINIATIGTNNRFEVPGTVEVSMGFPG